MVNWNVAAVTCIVQKHHGDFVIVVDVKSQCRECEIIIALFKLFFYVTLLNLCRVKLGLFCEDWHI